MSMGLGAHAGNQIGNIKTGRETRNDFRHLDTQPLGKLVAICARCAARTSETNPLVQRRMKQDGVPAIRMAQDANAGRINLGMRPQQGNPAGRVVQHLAH